METERKTAFVAYRLDLETANELTRLRRLSGMASDTSALKQLVHEAYRAKFHGVVQGDVMAGATLRWTVTLGKAEEQLVTIGLDAFIMGHRFTPELMGSNAPIPDFMRLDKLIIGNQSLWGPEGEGAASPEMFDYLNGIAIPAPYCEPPYPAVGWGVLTSSNRITAKLSYSGKVPVGQSVGDPFVFTMTFSGKAV